MDPNIAGVLQWGLGLAIAVILAYVGNVMRLLVKSVERLERNSENLNKSMTEVRERVTRVETLVEK
jgi:membrane protein implicated in regulation of membrane protease activity